MVSKLTQGQRGVRVVVNNNRLKKLVSLRSPTLHHKVAPKLNSTRLLIITTRGKLYV